MFIYDRKDIKKTDRLAIEQGFSMYSLMENAGNGLFQKIKTYLSKGHRIIILAGKGNNGGDGIVLARYLKQHGYNVTLTFPLGMPKTEVANKHLQFFIKQGFTISDWTKSMTYDVVIDSILGVGTKLPLSPDLEKIIKWCNHIDSLKIAIDIPTGVVDNHGVAKNAFQADYTFCLHGIKPSAFLLPAYKFYGAVKSIDIGLTHTSRIQILQKENIQKTIPHRESATHKGTFGTSLLIAGSDHMPGSALLGAIGAVRTGTGRLIIGTTKIAASIIATRVPEATFLINGLQEVIHGNIPEKISAAAIGPGIDSHEEVSLALKKLGRYHIPLVIDAGALIPLESWEKPTKHAPIILTPHPGEFSRLTKLPIKEIQANRIQLAKKFALKHKITLVLKGQYTIIAYPDGEILMNPTGNNALAKGGSGDILTGMILSMLATHKNWKDAVANAVYIHGLCADKWIQKNSQSSMVASDFDKLLPNVLREIELA